MKTALILSAAAFASAALVILALSMAPQPFGPAPPVKEVLLILDKTELYKGQRTLTYTVVNNTPETIGFGEPYDIQKKQDGEWVSVEWMKDRVWIAIYYNLESGKSLSKQVELPVDIEPGDYRLVKEVDVGGEKRVLVAEFTVLE
ncbi:MAG: hypothetical protein QXE96_00430 [Candidatus Caldarchaeum sp.]